MGKRGRGYGAVHWRPDGRWEGRIRIPGGRRRSFYARTRQDVIHRLAEARWALSQSRQPVPIGLANVANDFKSFRRFSEREHKKIVSWNQYESGGHYAAHQVPDLFVADVRSFFRRLN